ncbi:MAG: serine/threonine-protein kinase [Gemmatimonadales bacterium]
MTQPTRSCPTCHTPLPGMASFCYVCGTATPAGLNRETGEAITTTISSGIGPADLIRKLQRALGPGYELRDRIGAGGFAEVFHARDLRLKRDIAVKVLRPDLGLSPDLLQRFRREAETIATLRNPHIVPVYDIGEAEGLAFIIMPLITGESLRAVLDRDGAMPPLEVRRVLREAAQGLAAAHDAGVVHRDVKPENIMLEGRDRRVLVMDFGIAKAVGAVADDGDPAQALTTTGIIIGTPQYMSPEQACGDKSIDARTDQYSLAVVGYRMLAGKLPFEGESTRAMLYQQLVAEPPPIAATVAGVPNGLASAIQRAMAKEPSERFANMTEFAAALESEGITGKAEALVKPVPKRRSSAMMAGVAAGVVLLAGVAWFATRGSPATPAPPPPPPPPPTAPSSVTQPVAPPPAAAVPPPPVVTHGATSKPPSTKTANSAGGSAKPGSGKPGASTALAPPPPPAAPAAMTGSCAKLAASASWAAAAPACAREADAGNAVAQRILGTMYDKGTGVAESPADAVTWYRKASSSDMESKFLLSHMLEVGRGTTRNDAESAVLLREAAAGGWLRAQQMLAYRLETGTGIKKDETEAAVWYSRAAERGDAVSQLGLANLLAKGHGVEKNETEALVWYRKSADQGSAEAAWQLAQAYFKGHGTAKNDSAGMPWLRKAAAGNQPDAVKELKKRGG